MPLKLLGMNTVNLFIASDLMFCQLSLPCFALATKYSDSPIFRLFKEVFQQELIMYNTCMEHRIPVHTFADA